MIECRYCHEEFRKPPEKIGARCPTCRMPLFERDRAKAPPIDLGPCTFHRDKSAHGKCRACGKLICAVCRTRWQEEVVCPQCLDKTLQNEPNPQLAIAQNRQATLSLALAIVGWLILLATLLPLRPVLAGSASAAQANTVLFMFLASLLPALWAVGQGAACIRTRGRRLVIATWGVALAGAQLGLMMGQILINVWSA